MVHGTGRRLFPALLLLMALVIAGTSDAQAQPPSLDLTFHNCTGQRRSTACRVHAHSYFGRSPMRSLGMRRITYPSQPREVLTTLTVAGYLLPPNGNNP